MASNDDDNLNTPIDTSSMVAPTELVKKKRGRPRKSEMDVTPRKSIRQAEKKQMKKESVAIKLKGLNGKELDSDEEWSFDEEDEDYLATMFRKLNNSTPGVVEEDDDDDVEEEDEEDDDEEEDDEEEDALFQEDNKDVYDFDQQSSVMSQQGARVTRRWLNQQNKRGNIKSDPREGSSWGSNIYSHLATLLNTREDLDTYSRFLKCCHVNRGLDSLLADLCKPFRGSDGPSASLRNLISSINDSSHIVDLLRDVVSDRFDNAAHRVSHFVLIVKQPLCGLQFVSPASIDNCLHSIDTKMIGDSAFIVEADKTDIKRMVADVDTLIISDSLYAYINDQILSTSSNQLQRVVVGLDTNKSLFGVFVLGYWNRAGVPYNRPRCTVLATDNCDLALPLAASVTTDSPQFSDIEFIDAFFVRMGARKDVLHLVVAKPDSRFLVYNVVSEYAFALKRHGLSPTTPIVLEGMYSTFPEVLAEEKSVLVLPNQLYRSLARTIAREVASVACKFKKCVLLDKRTRLPLCVFFDTEVGVHIGDLHVVSEASVKLMLVSINGLLVALELDLATSSSPGKSVTKCYELMDETRAMESGRDRRRYSLQTTYLSTSQSVTVQMTNHDESEHTATVASLYHNVAYCKRQEAIDHVINDVVDRLYDLPLHVSLMDSLFRQYQRSLTASGGASTSGTAALVDSPAKCVFCGREFRAASIYDHEARHLALVKFKCHKHQMVFADLKSYRAHKDEYVNCDDIGIDGSGSASGRDHVAETHKLLNIAVPLCAAGLTISECPRCVKCYDYFPSHAILTDHSDVCDGVSFQARTPLDNSADHVITGDCNVCGLCGLNYPRAESLCAHMSSHVTCHLCKLRLGSIDDVSAHLRDHVTRNDTVSGRGIRKVMSCDVCGHFYGTKSNYYYHQWTEHGVVHPPIKSSAAATGGSDHHVTATGTGDGSAPATPATHKQRRSDTLSYMATGHKKFHCKFCDCEVKVSGKTYIKHLDNKHGLVVDLDCVCRICAEIFETGERLSDHLHASHLRSGQYVNAGIQSIFSCDKCTFFGHYAGVVTHSKTVHCDSAPCLYECPYCPERMLDRRLWRVHLERVHQHVHDGAPPLKNEVFVLTNHNDDDEAEADTHTASTNQIRDGLIGNQSQLGNVGGGSRGGEGGGHVCDICKKQCKSHKAVEVHRMKHFRTKIFQCNECQATFRSKLAMRRHVRVDHLNLEPERYECQICGKIVTQISMHMLIHKNARYQCEFCDKRFTKSAYYNEHVRIHKGEKPYECHICLRKFNKKSNLNVHVSFHEKHRDDYGNYLEIKPRGRGHPDYDPEKTRARKTAMIKYDAACGPDEPGASVCMQREYDDHCKFRAINVLTNSKSCDTDDLIHYIQLLQAAAAHGLSDDIDDGITEPDIKRLKY